jgi:capsid protein
MKIRTTIPVQHSLQNKPTTVLTSVVEGVVNSQNWTEDFTKFGVDYSYISVTTGDVVERRGWVATATDVENLYQMFKNDIPAGLTWAETNQWLVMQGFRYEMAETFGITFSETEVVTD